MNLFEKWIRRAEQEPSGPEMDVLVDMNSSLMNTEDGKPKASLHRHARPS